MYPACAAPYCLNLPAWLLVASHSGSGGMIVVSLASVCMYGALETNKQEAANFILISHYQYVSLYLKIIV